MIKTRFVTAIAVLCIAESLYGSTFNLDNVAIPTFSEGFDSSDSLWANAAFGPLDYVSADGNPGGHVSTEETVSIDSGTLFRGHVGFNSSDGNFAGDWIAEGIDTISFDVRHDYDQPLVFYARIATPQNFPAHVAIGFAPVPPGQWTTLTIDVTEGSPALINEAAPFFSYADTFSNVGNIQIGIDVDSVPEPGWLGLCLVGMAGITPAIRRRFQRQID